MRFQTEKEKLAGRLKRGAKRFFGRGGCFEFLAALFALAGVMMLLASLGRGTRLADLAGIWAVSWLWLTVVVILRSTKR